MVTAKGMVNGALGVLFVLACGGFIPVSGCAKGCGACARSGDDVVRVSARSASHSDDIMRGAKFSGARNLESSAARGRMIAPAAVAGDTTLLADDIVRAVDDLPVTKAQEGQIFDALDAAETAVEEGLGLIMDDDDSDAETDAQLRARVQLTEAVARDLDTKLGAIVEPEVRDALYAEIGGPDAIVARAVAKRQARAVTP